ncbi:hypothetical protein COCSADRAFT_35946 [Bipolaris sorokiniana ND90Pr]|uniref:3-hydroxyacyl-CoA dehydrogenase NAD binding domain-containing protein n=1 Tax=Cochliobolus sativus (strain ND90Pr / ATCC 201652) TaxID=665912 RepID=M2T9W2_COCSN|nr:uncharacterized protein COCSADRAFT_35946 [Bipolaris sorokiniana ND90Pr]EMD66016.1 hypothetical protein COCSADRAFT_35946 [Bipolaris sorokiniana ND90Pr]
MARTEPVQITVVGSGTIGLSFAAFYTVSHRYYTITIYNTRRKPDSYTNSKLLALLPLDHPTPAIRYASTLQEAVQNASIIQECGPENLLFKQSLWSEIERFAPQDALLWSSTSGIPASLQSQRMQDKSRLLVVHPYNPPHIMPLLELVPSAETCEDVIQRTKQFWVENGRVPVHIKREITGFVANRLAFALLREAIHLVHQGIVSVEEVDNIVEMSMGPRWAVAGPFKSYHAGGGEGGLEGFFRNIGGTVQACWEDGGRISVGGEWEKIVFEQAKEIYGVIDIEERDRITSKVLEAVRGECTSQSSCYDCGNM